MGDEFRSILLGASGLAILAVIAVFFTVTRRKQTQQPGELARLALVVVAGQCVHFLEEFITGFHLKFPALLGLAPWTTAFFVTFNVVWIAIWLLSAAGVYCHFRPAYFPIWFLALAATGNGVVHPLLALAVAGYFPGLLSSPALGLLGWRLFRKLRSATRSAPE